MLDLDRVLMDRLSQLANDKCEQVQAIVKEKDEAVALLGQEPVIPRIDNKIVCGNCPKKRAGGPRDGFNTSDAEYMSMARERKSSHPSWCPGACIPKFCKRPYGVIALLLCDAVLHCCVCAAHSDTPEGRAVLRSSRPYTRSERSRRSFSPRPRARGKAIVDCEKARTGSTNGKKSQLQNGIRNADEYRGAFRSNAMPLIATLPAPLCRQ
jgi:hypothetical protein